MAQQTINVGAAPNDGTGTPLRTAFQYTNSNFTELYTAVGPSGNNIVVPGTATITGNLTVDTNVLFVDAANNRVGIGTTSPAYAFQVNGRISYNAGIGEAADLTLSSSGTVLQLGAGSAWTETRHYVAGAEAMRLNSTGLGVGVSPSAKLHIQGAAAQAIFSVGSATDARHEYYRNSVLEGLIGWDANTMRVGAFQAGGKLELWSGGSTKATLDSSGNVGVGVSTFGTSAARVLSIATGTEPTTGPTGTVQWFTSTRSANNTIPAIFTEGSGVTNAAITNVTVTNKIALKVNGTIYYLLATTSAS
jgi:hypothetical protein